MYAVNTEYTPSDVDEQLLDVLAAQPAGRANPYLLREETGLSKQRVSNSLRQLVAAGWVDKRTRGLYDLVADVDSSASDELLAGWEPDTDASGDRARTETRRVVGWLEETGGRHKRAEIVERCLPDGLNEEYWWTAVVRPGLLELAERGLVEYRSNYPDYRWSG